jgi:hypothetical protein
LGERVRLTARQAAGLVELSFLALGCSPDSAMAPGRDQVAAMPSTEAQCLAVPSTEATTESGLVRTRLAAVLLGEGRLSGFICLMREGQRWQLRLAPAPGPLTE